MRVLITGSRDWEREVVIYFAMRKVADTFPNEQHTLVSGACPTGADTIGEDIARMFGWTVERHPADWVQHGRAAGPIRNAEMVNLGAEICLAFIRNGSRGASGTAALAETAGIVTSRFTAG